MVQDLKVLICDDSLFVRKKMKDIITALGVTQVFEATDGENAVTKYAATNPDIVFMDIVMPVKSGLEALKDILSIDPQAKIVMASSVGTQSNIKDAITAGAFSFLQKPIEQEDIKKILDKISN